MNRKVITGIMLTLLLVGMLTLAFNIQHVSADPLSIGSDYTFTKNIYEPIVVTANNIVIDGAGYTVQGTGSGTGIHLSSRNNVTLKNVEVTNFHTGIFLWNTTNSKIENVTASNNEYGIFLRKSSNNNTFAGNIASNNNYGINLSYSSNNTLSGNTASNNNYGIFLLYSSNNTFAGNIASNNTHGIRLDYSSNNVLTGNTASNNQYNFGVWSFDISDFNNYVDTSNTVDGKPIYYLIDEANVIIDAKTNAGTIYLINSNNITVRDLTLTKNWYGAFLWNTTNSKIENITASNNEKYGIFLRRLSNNNVLTGNTASNNNYGIFLISSSNNVLTGNTASNNNYGISLDYSSNNVLTGNTASNNAFIGIYLYYSSNKTLAGNIASNNNYGIRIDYSSNNVLSGNTASTNNNYGISLWESSNNVLFHNNFIINTEQVYLYESFNNLWDNGYPSGGNYWSDYNGTDADYDGIGDAAYFINEYNQDNYPLMGMFHSFNTSLGLHVNVISNSSIRDFEYSKSNSTIKMQVSNMTANQTFGFCRVCIPHALMSEPYNVTIDGANPVFWNYTLYDNGTHRWIYFAYQHSTHEVIIQGLDTAPPIIFVLSPENKTYPLNEVPLTFTVDEPTDWMGYSLDGQANVTITGNTTLSGLLDGSHYVVVYANDTAGNMGASSTVYFAVDTVPPNIIDVSQTPLEDNVLPEDEVKVNATVTDELSGVKQVFLNYTNGNGTWFTVEMTNLVGNVWNATIPAFPYGTNVTYRIIAEDNMNNTITTEDLGYEYQYTVIPEFPTGTSILLILILLSIAIAIYERRLLKTPIH